MSWFESDNRQGDNKPIHMLQMGSISGVAGMEREMVISSKRKYCVPLTHKKIMVTAAAVLPLYLWNYHQWFRLLKPRRASAI